MIYALQEKSLATGQMRASIWGDGSSGIFRLFKEENETVDHIVSGCKMLCGKIYLQRHILICTYVHWAVLKDLGAKMCDSWLKHSPQQYTKCGNVVVMYDHLVINDRMVKHNKPYLFIYDK